MQMGTCLILVAWLCQLIMIEASVALTNQENSDENSHLELSSEYSHFESERDNSIERVHPFMYEPLAIISGSDTGESDSNGDNSPRLLNLNR